MAVANVPHDFLSDELHFSVVRGGPFYNLRKRVGLVGEKGLAIVPRILFLILLTWVPMAIGAYMEGVAVDGQTNDPLMRHFGIHTRLLIALPLLLLAEIPMERNLRWVIRHFHESGIVAPEDTPRLVAVLRSTERLRDSIWGKLLLVVAIGAVIAMSATDHSIHNHELVWTEATDPNPHATFAGWWFMYVARPVFAGVLSLWAWRLVVVWILMKRISKLPLRLVPGHPDEAGGLRFLELIATACSPLVFANSVVLAGRWAHDVRYHGQDVRELQPLVIAYVVASLVIFLGPFLMFSKTLLHFKHESLLKYAVLMGNQGRLVDDKWIQKKNVGDNPLLGPPEIGPMADAASLFNTVSKIGFFPLPKESVIRLVAAAVLPIIPVFALQIPLKEILLSLGKGLL